MEAGRRHGGPYYDRFLTVASLRGFAIMDSRMISTGNGDGSSLSVVYLADTREVKRPTFRMSDGNTCPCTRFAGQCVVCGNLATWRAMDGLHETHCIGVPGYKGSSSDGNQHKGCTHVPLGRPWVLHTLYGRTGRGESFINGTTCQGIQFNLGTDGRGWGLELLFSRMCRPNQWEGAAHKLEH